MKKVKFIILFCSVFFTSIVNAQQRAAKSNGIIGGPAPELHIAKWLKGDSTSKFKRGRVYVVEFWATWCKPCIAGMPHLSDLARRYRQDVSIIGVNVMERTGTAMSVIEKFVGGMGNKMDYHVAVEKEGRMTQDWLRSYGFRGIPTAFIVDREGDIAWAGLPAGLDKVLPQVIAGEWDNARAAMEHQEYRRLTELDNNLVVSTLNPTMGNPGDPQGALKKIDELVKENPGLKYYPKTAHFTIWSLVKLNSEKVVEYYHGMKAFHADPPFNAVTDAVYDKDNLNAAIYLIAVDAYEEQLRRYPWSMNFAETYNRMAALYEKAGNPAKAVEMRQKAEKSATP